MQALLTARVGGLIFSGISAGASIFSGISAAGAFSDEADALREQGDIQQAEAEAEALRLEKEDKAARAKTKMAFIKGGVTLAGSPFLLLDAQKTEDEKFQTSVRRRGVAQRRLARKKADISKSRGRAALIGGFGQAAATGFTAFK